MALIEARDITFAYAGTPVLKDITFSVREGEVLTLLGPNGSGKSTLLKVVLGLVRPVRGTVYLKGGDTSRISRRQMARQIAYVPQTHRSAFPYTVLDVILMGRMPHKTFFFAYSRDDVEIASQVLERLSIGHLSRRPYTQLSGGERQLVLIGRALAQGARIFIIDQPATGLDYGNQIRLLEEISSLSREGYTFIKSTHSPEHALWIADRAVMIKEGRIIADGRCDDVISDESLHHLYGARVNVIKLQGSLRTCIPGAAGAGRPRDDDDKGGPGAPADRDRSTEPVRFVAMFP